MMNRTLMDELLDATRLTRTGQLHEATAAIQRALGNMPNPEDRAEAMSTASSSTTTPGATLEGSYRVVDDEPAAAATSASSEWQRQASAEKFEAGHETVSARQAGCRYMSASNGLNTAGLQAMWREKLGHLGGHEAWSQPLSARPGDNEPDAGHFTSGTFSNHAGTRDYKLYIPSGYHGQPLPLVVMLHGCTQNPDDFAVGTGMNKLAEEQLCVVLYPTQPAAANSSKCWNWFKATDQQRERGEPAIIAGMTRQVIDEYQLDAQRVYVAGLSAGGAMAATLAVTYPDLYAAVGIHSGLPHAVAQDLPSALAAMQGGTGPLASHTRKANAVDSHSANGPAGAGGIPAVVFHGDRDTTVHPCNGDRVVAQSAQSLAIQKATNKGQSVDVERGRVPNGHAYTCTTYHGANGQPMVEQWVIHGAGHAWAGGNPRGSYTDSQGPDATREMLRFFFAHPKAMNSTG